MKKLGTRITDEHKQKLLALCDLENLHQGEMIEKLIDYYLDNPVKDTDLEVKSEFIDQLELNESETKEVQDAVINSGQELKANRQRWFNVQS